MEVSSELCLLARILTLQINQLLPTLLQINLRVEFVLLDLPLLFNSIGPARIDSLVGTLLQGFAVLGLTVAASLVAEQLGAVRGGPIVLRVPVPASSRDRSVQLVWAKTTKLAAPDTRRAAARLVLLAITPATR